MGRSTRTSIRRRRRFARSSSSSPCVETSAVAAGEVTAASAIGVCADSRETRISARLRSTRRHMLLLHVEHLFRLFRLFVGLIVEHAAHAFLVELLAPLADDNRRDTVANEVG